MVLVPLFDLKFLNELAAGVVETSNRRHQAHAIALTSDGVARVGRLLLAVAILLGGFLAAARAADPAEVRIGYLRVTGATIALSMMQTPAGRGGSDDGHMRLDTDNAPD